jgi:predicted RNA polymerase sigma factor
MLLDEALRLGRVLAGLVPDEPEAHGLVALMEIQASRTRHGSAGEGSPSRCWSRTALGGTGC